jgi:uncharacterized protein
LNNTPQHRDVFLTAEWRDLAMLNYQVDPHLLADRVPPGTVLDSFEGATYVSLVGFQFRRTKLYGSLAIPFHRDFEEVNLRFYVRRNAGNEDRRGVVFIAEIVPKRAVARIARIVYRENYIRLPMGRKVQANGHARTAEYNWRLDGSWCKLYARASDVARRAEERSLEQFITEHYWGYSRQGNGSALEYHVSHPPWNISKAAEAGFDGDVTSLYGTELARTLQRTPHSAFIADGSSVVVFKGKRIE